MCVCACVYVLVYVHVHVHRHVHRLSSVATPQRDGGRLLWEDLASGSAAWTGLRPYAPYTGG